MSYFCPRHMPIYKFSNCFLSLLVFLIVFCMSTVVQAYLNMLLSNSYIFVHVLLYLLTRQPRIPTHAGIQSGGREMPSAYTPVCHLN